MPRSIELIFCSLVFWIYDENGAPLTISMLKLPLKENAKPYSILKQGK